MSSRSTSKRPGPFSGDEPEELDPETWSQSVRDLLTYIEAKRDATSADGAISVPFVVTQKLTIALADYLELLKESRASEMLRANLKEAERRFRETRNPREVVRKLGLARREGRPSRDREAALTLYLELTQTAGVHRRPNGERVKHFVSRARALVLVAEAHGYASALGCREDLMPERNRVQIRIKRLRGEGEEVPADLERLAEAKFPKRSEM